MSFIARELERLSRALHADPEPDHCAELRAAQQALAWALEPSSALSPYAVITGTVQDAGGCSAVCRQAT